MTITITKLTPDNLSKNTYSFRFTDRYGIISIQFEKYTYYIRPTKKHKFKIDEIWQRQARKHQNTLNASDMKILVFPDIIKEAKEQYKKQIDEIEVRFSKD